jgi:leucyl-tRNA---protein transferase
LNGFEMAETEHPDRDGSSREFDMERLPRSLPIADTVSNEHACSYLPDMNANMPLKLPARRLTGDEFDFALAHGIRRSGLFLYHTACPTCAACEPARVDVNMFQWRDSFMRVLKHGDDKLHVVMDRPILNDARLALFNLHRVRRGLGEADSDYRASDYEGFLVQTCCEDTVELSFWCEDSLVAVSIVDCGRASLSAVYTFFDPDYSKLSPGTYSILKQIQLARITDRSFVYLGMYVSQNTHLSYKSRFTPQQRHKNGKWISFSDDSR